jgi:two-component system, NtrC family, response regulator GlrR
MQDFSEFNLVGRSPAFLSALNLIKKFATCDATVLVQGETGTGKELAARAVHYLGARRDGPFIAVNCGALPETLVESELFGHARGAFTDAKQSRPGLVAEAQGGTLFLDEIDSMSPRVQVALLRFLEEREYRPVGGAVVKRADVRVIAASNCDLEALVARKTYREDLLYRLNVLALRLPPLRERTGDAGLLAEAFIQRFSLQYKTPVKRMDEETIAYLERNPWKGNIRELENFVLRQFILSEGNTIRLHSSLAAGATPTDGLPGKSLVTDCKFQDISLAARMSGKERSRLGKLAKKYGLERNLFATGSEST